MSGAVRLVALYALFAALAIVVNLGAQALAMAVYTGSFAIPASIFVGTGAGLLVKYVLDKRHIFDFESENLAHDGRLFVLYTAMGIFTTLLFWAVEYAFHHAFGTDAMRYLGGALGLTAGYLIKYQLDKRYVFVSRQGGAA